MTARARNRKAMTWCVAGLGALGVAAGTLAAAGAAVADVTEVAPGPDVYSRQASVSSYVGVRNNAPSVARGTSETRLADGGGIEAQGEVRDSVKAVPGRGAGGFQGPWPVGAPMGDF